MEFIFQGIFTFFVIMTIVHFVKKMPTRYDNNIIQNNLNLDGIIKKPYNKNINKRSV